VSNVHERKIEEREKIVEKLSSVKKEHEKRARKIKGRGSAKARTQKSEI
jgi:hypothetical protein